MIRSGIPGKLGRIQLKGKPMEKLRRERFTLDGWCCVDCGRPVSWASGHLAHVQSRGAGGSDTIENTRTKCLGCHNAEHNCGGRPLPRKCTVPYIETGEKEKP